MLLAVFGLITGGHAWAVEPSGQGNSHQPPLRLIDQTVVVGESDPILWKAVIELLPSRPSRIQILDLNSLSASARGKLRGFDAFVLAGQTTIVVIRQGATLRNAEFGDAVDRLMLASLVWHEMAHTNGLDERAALEQEQALWRRFIASGLVSGGDGMAYITRLREASAAVASESVAEGSVADRRTRGLRAATDVIRVQ